MKKRTEDIYQLTIRLPISLYNNVLSYTEQNGIMMNEFVTRAVQEKYLRVASEQNVSDNDFVPRAEFQSSLDEMRYELEQIKSLYASAVASEKGNYAKPLRRV